MKDHRIFGRSCTFVSSLALLALSGWELSIRLDAMYRPLKMFFDMAVGEGIPLDDAMRYFDFGLFEAPLWLLLCILAALITLCFAHRPKSAVVTLPLSVLLGVYGLGRETTLFVGFWRLVQPALLLFNAVLIALNLAAGSFKRSKKAHKPVEPSAPRFHDAPRLRKAAREDASDHHASR